MRLAIDPGRDTGWALLAADGKLVDCGLGDPRPARTRLPASSSSVVIERPQIYQGRMSKADPNDIITLAILVGRYTEHFDFFGVEHILPHTWKGTVDPDVLCHRIVKSLPEDERALLVGVLTPLARTPLEGKGLVAGKRHNVIDAVGLAKWSIKRARAGVF